MTNRPLRAVERSEKHSDTANLRQGAVTLAQYLTKRDPDHQRNPNQLLLVTCTRRAAPKTLSKFVNNFLSYPANTQTDKQTNKQTDAR